MILGIDHVGLAVHDAAAAASTISRLVDQPATAIELVAAQAVRVCFVPAQAAARVELLEPTGDDTPVGRFLARRGEGLHHVCFAVDDLAAELARLARHGFQPIDAAPRPGHGGLVAFLQPRSAHGVLVELLQRDPSPAAAGERREPPTRSMQ